jgi:hypothetical protein
VSRRKPLSRRLTILSLARNLTSKQEHQLVAMADRARHMEADLADLRAQVERVRALADVYSRGRGSPTARRLRAALDGRGAPQRPTSNSRARSLPPDDRVHLAASWERRRGHTGETNPYLEEL